MLKFEVKGNEILKVLQTAVRGLQKSTPSNVHWEVGLLPDGKGGQVHPDSDKTVAELGYLHEKGFSVKGVPVPPRPFIESAQRDVKLQKKMIRLVKKQAKLIAKGEADPKTMTATMDKAAGTYERSIRSRLYSGKTTPSLVPVKSSTIKGRKDKNPRPLVNTKTLARSIETKKRGA